MRRSGSRLLAAAMILAVGCGKSEPATATVKGAVTFQGRPLAGGLIVFAPDREKGNAGESVHATVGPDGWYYLSADGSARVAAGWYRVAIAEAPGWSADDAHGPRFPAALRRPDRAGLDREVVAGRENVFHFEIEVPQ
ncbi:MAG TPA: hypothetical protein VFG68_00085 [Fimbriiglobus sp.]|nr:hypothetical protein [Fimbriiglobus sp.]